MIAEFVAISRLNEFLPLLFKAMNEIGEDQEFKDRQATLFPYFDFWTMIKLQLYAINC
ncbi:hypothetical protein [Sphingobacterium faecium]|uniref:hypothetical protein n=1 Tax=Sphingobacterium faecium TaxID=34087 RepID=UPI0012928C59|nr:hypothetical protein [Sphingobacterium faecium]